MPRRVIMLAALAAMLCAPAVAQGDAFDDVFRDYAKHGKIRPCEHTAAELRSAKRQVPNDIEQYAPDFPDALDQALEDRARSGCAKAGAAGGGGSAAGGAGASGTSSGTAAGAAPTAAGAGSAAGAAATPAGTPAPPAPGSAASVPQPPGAAQPAPPASDGAIVNAAQRTAARGADGVPAPLIALAVLGALVLIALLVWGLARFFAWDPAWLAGARHATQEAGWHVSGLWDDFTDWLRPGRRGAT